MTLPDLSSSLALASPRTLALRQRKMAQQVDTCEKPSYAFLLGQNAYHSPQRGVGRLLSRDGLV
jgi:hypothetical protein